jgi:hypothetical protein
MSDIFNEDFINEIRKQADVGAGGKLVEEKLFSLSMGKEKIENA